MAKIVFFNIPAYGHTHPTLGVVQELVRRGHSVWYFSYDLFKERIEAVGADFISCDAVDIQMNPTKEDQDRVGKDLGFSIMLLTNTTLAMDEMVCGKLEEIKPDCIIADSMAVWGRFAALKMNIPFVSSTTTFAFNRYSAKIMKPSFAQVFAMLKAMPSMRRDIRKLRSAGYPVKNGLSLIQNDNDTDTLVYTSSLFQPCADTFSSHYAFIGPCVSGRESAAVPSAEMKSELDGRKLIYISLGTVNNNLPDFYRCCIQAFRDCDVDVMMAVGKDLPLVQLGEIPESFIVKPSVDQLDVLRRAAVFISHGGMNSVNESLSFEVPLVLTPQTPEQGAVAARAVQLNAGVLLKEIRPETIRQTVEQVLQDQSIKESIAVIARSFRQAGGAKAAAEAIERKLRSGSF